MPSISFTWIYKKKTTLAPFSIPGGKLEFVRAPTHPEHQIRKLLRLSVLNCVNVLNVLLSIRRHQPMCRHPLDIFSALLRSTWIWFGRARYFLLWYLYRLLLFLDDFFRVPEETSGRGKNASNEKIHFHIIGKSKSSNQVTLLNEAGVVPDIYATCTAWFRLNPMKKSKSRKSSPFCDIGSVFLNTRYMSPCQPLTNGLLFVPARYLFGRLFRFGYLALKTPLIVV